MEGQHLPMKVLLVKIRTTLTVEGQSLPVNIRKKKYNGATQLTCEGTAGKNSNNSDSGGTFNHRVTQI